MAPPKGFIPWNKGLTKSNSQIIKEGTLKMQRTKVDKFASGELKVWNKGKTNIYSKEVIESNRQKHLGGKLSEEHKDKIRKKLKARRLSEEHKTKIGENTKKNLTGKNFYEIHGLIGSMEMKAKISSNNWMRRMKGKFPEETLKKKSDNMLGQNNPMFGLRGEKSHAWMGGLKLLPYDKNFNKWFKESIRIRDNFCCVKCGMCNEDHKELFANQSLQIHHINYNKKLSCPENCITLCCRCNNEVNYNRPHWTKFFQGILKEMHGYNYDEQGNIIFDMNLICDKIK